MASGIIPTDGMALLWTNGSPTSSFSAQTISVDLSKYSHVCIGFRGWQNDATVSFIIAEVGQAAVHFEVRNATATNQYAAVFQRTATVSATGIAFSACSGKLDIRTQTVSTYNDGLIPFKIYGIK